MSQFMQVIVFSGMLQMCGDSSSSGGDESPYEFSCEDYQLMVDVEIRIGEACSSDADCTQVLISGDMACEPNSIVVSDDFDTSYFSELYDEAVAAGCDITLEMNEDCSATEVVCAASTCSWSD